MVFPKFGKNKKRKESEDNPQQSLSINPDSVPKIKVPDRYKKTFNELSTRKIIPTRFYHQPSCQSLGVDEGVRRVADNFGWLGFLNLHENTYESITLEFLSTVSMKHINIEGEPLECEIKFRLFNAERTLTLTRLNEIFSWPTLNQIYDPDSFQFAAYDEQRWWNTIAGYSTFTPRSSHASHILHPVLRIFGRSMGYACFPKQDMGKLTREEIKCLFVASRFEGDLEGNVNMGYMFIKRCMELRDRPEMSGEIKCGGMISIIARNLGFGHFLDAMEEVPGSIWLDIRGLSSMKFIVDVSRRVPCYSWKVRDRHHCMLPNPIVMGTVGNTWQVPFEPPPEGVEDHAPNVPQPRRASVSIPRRHGEASSSSSSRAPFDLEASMNNLTLLNQQILRENEYQSYVAQRMFQRQVELGEISPYLNYPNRPVQEGPVPGWNNRQPTYPYHPQRNVPPYDYRISGGSDPRGDPAYPSEGWPQGYTGGWDPFPAPPFEFGNYPNVPNYDWPPYTDASGPDVDPTYNFRRDHNDN